MYTRDSRMTFVVKGEKLEYRVTGYSRGEMNEGRDFCLEFVEDSLYNDIIFDKLGITNRYAFCNKYTKVIEGEGTFPWMTLDGINKIIPALMQLCEDKEEIEKAEKSSPMEETDRGMQVIIRSGSRAKINLD